MRLTDKEREFLDRRTKLIRLWPVTGGILLCLLLGLAAWLYAFNPLLANPFVVFSRIRSGSIPPPELELMAALLPIVFLLAVAVTLFTVLLAFAELRNEKRQIAVIRRLLDQG